MATNKNSGQHTDEWSQRLQADLRRRRPRFWRITLFVSLPLLMVGVFVLWLAYPRPTPPRLMVVGLDTVFSTDEAPRLRARLEPLDPTVTEPRTAGIEVLFFDARPPAQGQRQAIKSVTNAQGEAIPDWPLPDESNQAAYLVQHVGDKYRPGSDDGARLFRWPANSKLIVIDIEETLLGGDGDVLLQEEPAVKPPRAAVKALQSARAMDQRIVYLSAQPRRAADYRRSRVWVGRLFSPSGFPDGPVLGRRSYDDAVSVADARLDVVKDLRKRFTGPLVVVVGKVETAEQLRQRGITSLLLSEVPVPADHLKSWDDLPAWIGK